jgi:hypothetical protein
MTSDDEFLRSLPPSVEYPAIVRAVSARTQAGDVWTRVSRSTTARIMTAIAGGGDPEQVTNPADLPVHRREWVAEVAVAAGYPVAGVFSRRLVEIVVEAWRAIAADADLTDQHHPTEENR